MLKCESSLQIESEGKIAKIFYYSKADFSINFNLRIAQNANYVRKLVTLVVK